MASKYAKDILSLTILYSDKDSDVENLFLLPELGKRSEKHAEKPKEGRGMESGWTTPPCHNTGGNRSLYINTVV